MSEADEVAVDQYLNKELSIDAPYQITSMHEYYIFGANKDVVETLVEKLNEPKFKHEWPDIIHVLGILSADGGNPDLVEEIMSATKRWEKSTELNSNNRLSYLTKAYDAIAYSNSNEGLSFLQERVRKDFWEGGSVPSESELLTHSGLPPKTITAQSEAIAAISKHPSKTVETYLESLKKHPDFSSDEVLMDRIERGLRMRPTWLSGHQKRIRAFEVKKELSGASNDLILETSKKPTTEPIATPTTIEVIEEVTAPEPTIEEPAEEDVEQSSNSWRWLIGAVVVVGGLGLALRRKS